MENYYTNPDVYQLVKHLNDKGMICYRGNNFKQIAKLIGILKYNMSIDVYSNIKSFIWYKYLDRLTNSEHLLLDINLK